MSTAEHAPTTSSAARLPAVDRVLGTPALKALIAEYGNTAATQAVRAAIDELRPAALAGEVAAENLQPDAIAQQAASRLAQKFAPRLKAVFNLTGTVLHTNLGRALLPDAAVNAVVQALTTPANLEFDLATGGRGDRDDLVNDLLRELTGAEAATVVNNNAAAVLLTLNALAAKKEVIVSRGELVEIGGAFRIPDIMSRAGAKLVEVGTTNRTHAKDYADNITDDTALLMKVHCSNYEVTGFTKSVTEAEVAAIAHARGLPLAVDLGSGTLIDLAQYGLPHEATVRETIEAGADIVTFSGDKLLGGPQAGILAGRADLIARLRKNPLKRALRAGKLTLAALEAVLALYREPEFLAAKLPTLRLLTRPAADIETQAQRVLPAVQAALDGRCDVAVAAVRSQIGSGALPVERLASFGLAIRVREGRRGDLDRLDRALRHLPRPVLGRIADKTLWLDLRCLDACDEAEFAAQWSRLGA